MIFINELKEQKRLQVYIVADFEESGMRADWYKSEMKRYHDLGYTINQVLIPEYNDAPEELQEMYRKAYMDKAICDSVVDSSAYTVLWEAIRQCVEQRLADMDDAEFRECVKGAVKELK